MQATAAPVSYYSHPATKQDEWIIEKTGGRRHGYFVEVGAHNGVHHSNTLTLEAHFGWNGILIEPDPMLFAQLHMNRPASMCCRVVVDNEISEGKEFYFGGSYGGLKEHMPQSWLQEHSRRETKIGVVPTSTLHALLENLQAPTIIDYLSLDVEGAELPILEKLFQDCLEKEQWYCFRFLSVEFRYDTLLLDRLVERLGSKDYELDCVRGFDACFRHKYHGA